MASNCVGSFAPNAVFPEVAFGTARARFAAVARAHHALPNEGRTAVDISARAIDLVRWRLRDNPRTLRHEQWLVIGHG